MWWLSKSSTPKASNKRVLQAYKQDMKYLFKHGYNSGPRPSEHVISKKWGTDNGGAIPSNLIIASNTNSTDPYLKACKAQGLPVHPARFVPSIPSFFIRFLTEPGDLVLDPFGGSNVVGFVAEQLKRRWVSSEINEDYVKGSHFRFNPPLPTPPPATQPAASQQEDSVPS
ncbi:MAG: site-specific DNA-methyltransferase [Elusimicrobia bacterium]|nr:site-specific DNA-methyltransferase [Elusimicrobiota bacterium]